MTRGGGQGRWAVKGFGNGQVGGRRDGRGWGSAFSGVDGDDLASASADKKDPVETFSEDLKELHVWLRKVKEL